MEALANLLDLKLTSSMSSKPVKTRVFNSSHPMPPAPTQRTFDNFICDARDAMVLSDEQQNQLFHDISTPSNPMASYICCSQHQLIIADQA